MKSFKFFYDPQVSGVEAEEEIFEFDDDVTDEEVKKEFTEWLFNQIDTAIIPLN